MYLSLVFVIVYVLACFKRAQVILFTIMDAPLHNNSEEKKKTRFARHVLSDFQTLCIVWVGSLNYIRQKNGKSLPL